MMGEKQTQASPLAEIPSIAEIIKLLSTNAFRPPRARLGLFTPHAHFSPSHTDKEPNTAPPRARITHWAQPSRALRYLIFLHATSLPSWAQVLSLRPRRVSPPAIIQFSHLLSKYPRGLFCALGFVARYLTPDYASRPSKSSGPAGSTLATGLSRHASGMVQRAGTSTHWAACPSTRLSKGGHTVLRWVNCQMGSHLEMRTSSHALS